MSVRFHGAAGRPGQAALVAVLLTGICLALAALASPLTALLLSLLLWGSLADYFLPCHYCISEERLVVRKGLITQSYCWSRFRSVQLDRHGVLLSPFGKRHRLETFRGVFLAMDSATARELVPQIWEKLA